MPIRTLAFASALALVTSTAMANMTTTEDFVSKASIANQFEIESSELALERAKSADVKSFAKQMIEDHTNAGEKLEDVLDAADSRAEPEEELDDKHQQLVDQLESTTSSEDFDRQYLMLQKQAHEEAVSLFSNYAKNGTDKSLKNFASETLPTLQQHLEHVTRLKSGE